MQVSELRPEVEGRVRFAYPGLRELPSDAGCYVLATVDECIVYIGQSVEIARRVVQHFEDPEKRVVTPSGMAFWCYYRRSDELGMSALERGWLHQHQISKGALPYFNKQSGPV